jgi:hypothetical protein
MALHPQPEQSMAVAGVERPGPLAALPQTGSLQREWRRCGKHSCPCARGILHGPYWYLRWREHGRQRRQYVRRDRRDAIHVALEERRRLRPPVWSLRQSLTELRRLAKEIQECASPSATGAARARARSSGSTPGRPTASPAVRRPRSRTCAPVARGSIARAPGARSRPSRRPRPAPGRAASSDVPARPRRASSTARSIP